ncbi:MAG: alpha/beta fold hydrolase [Chloroflexota bacterium]
MRKILIRLLGVLAVLVSIYFIGALALVTFGVPGESVGGETLRFDELTNDAVQLPPLQTYTARDGSPLMYRHYAVDSDRALILLHGSGSHSEYLYPLAMAIAASGEANVYTPDLRGHGENPERRGDIDYIDQFIDDVADLMAHIQEERSFAQIIVGGHSSGGGLTLRFAESDYNNQADAYLLLAPYVAFNAPTTRPNSGGWATPYTGRIIGLILLNNVGITALNGLPAIDFDMPPEFRTGTETLSYTYRLNTGYAPQNYAVALEAIDVPLLLVAGGADEAFFADQYESTVTAYTEADVVILPDVSHMGAVVDEDVQMPVIEWLQNLK